MGTQAAGGWTGSTVRGRPPPACHRLFFLCHPRIGRVTGTTQLSQGTLEHAGRAVRAKLVHENGNGFPDDTPNLAHVAHAEQHTEYRVTIRPLLSFL